MQSGGSGVPGRRVRGQIADPGSGFLVHSGFGHAQILATDPSGRQSWGEAHRRLLAGAKNLLVVEMVHPVRDVVQMILHREMAGV